MTSYVALRMTTLVTRYEFAGSVNTTCFLFASFVSAISSGLMLPAITLKRDKSRALSFFTLVSLCTSFKMNDGDKLDTLLPPFF